jgi:lysophospholipase L1-like esterase
LFQIRFVAVSLVCLFEAAAGLAATNVACVGDSITYGYGVTGGETYPGKLQTLLGSAYSVSNYGWNGATLLRKGDISYWTTSTYTNSHGNPTPPDIVIIMLGSNDSKPKNWAYKTNFITDYTDLIATYTSLPTHPRVLICTPPPVFGSGAWNINPGVVATNIAPTVRQLGVSLGREVIDMHARFAGRAEWFPDTVHPNSMGTTVMAAIVYTALRGDTMNGDIPHLGITLSGSNKAVVDWPAAGAGWVLQTTSGLGGGNSWGVETRLAANDSISIRFTNSVTAGGAAIFRLWRP